MVKYVAFLRGINVGGHKKLKMEDLRQAFASWGFQNAKTLLASGNVVFEAQETNPDSLAAAVEGKISSTFGMAVSVVIRTLDQVQGLVDATPFENVPVTEQTRLYVTFLSGNPPRSLTVPYESPGKEFKIISVSDSEVCSVLTLTAQGGTTNAMDILEKEFGKNITTRNWNTITKVAQM